METPFTEMRGKVCVVTGASSGIGKRAALNLARSGATVVLACRDQARGRAALDEIRAERPGAAADLLLVDLSSQRSVRAFAAAFQNRYPALHVLINNAAAFPPSLKRATLTEDGVETIFATNHLGPFLLTNLFLDVLKRSAPARVINVASKGLFAYPRLTIEFDNLRGERRYSVPHAYYHSKLAQVMFTYDLAERLAGAGVAVNCVRVPNVALDRGRYRDMGPLLSGLYAVKRRFAITPEAMAEAYLYLATSPDVEGITGKYFDEHGRVVRSSRNSYDRDVWHRLWRVSARLTGLDPADGKGISGS